MIINEIKTPTFACGKAGVTKWRREKELVCCEIAQMQPLVMAGPNPSFESLLSVYVEFHDSNKAERFEKEMQTDSANIVIPDKKQRDRSGVARICFSSRRCAVTFGFSERQQELIQWGRNIEEWWRAILKDERATKNGILYPDIPCPFTEMAHTEDLDILPCKVFIIGQSVFRSAFCRILFDGYAKNGPTEQRSALINSLYGAASTNPFTLEMPPDKFKESLFSLGGKMIK